MGINDHPAVGRCRRADVTIPAEGRGGYDCQAARSRTLPRPPRRAGANSTTWPARSSARSLRSAGTVESPPTKGPCRAPTVARGSHRGRLCPRRRHRPVPMARTLETHAHRGRHRSQVTLHTPDARDVFRGDAIGRSHFVAFHKPPQMDHAIIGEDVRRPP